MTRAAGLFRETFTFVNKDIAKWFPGHMKKGKDQVLKILKHVDCIIEVHDARIPFSGRNPWFQNVMSVRPRLLVYNKIDLADVTYKKDIETIVRTEGEVDILYTNCRKSPKELCARIVKSVIKLVDQSNRYNRAEENSINLLIIGIPNVGKSSLINLLRTSMLGKSKAAKVGSKPGVTRALMEKIKISQSPLIYLYDTPGILSPDVKDADTGLKLALCANIHDHLVGSDVIVDYMLYWLNKQEKFSYVDYFGLPEPTDDVLQFMAHIAKRDGKTMKVFGFNGYEFRHDFAYAAVKALQAFRSGDLGKVMLDKDFIEEHTNNLLSKQKSSPP